MSSVLKKADKLNLSLSLSLWLGKWVIFFWESDPLPEHMMTYYCQFDPKEETN